MRGAVHFTIDFITNKWDHPRVCGEQKQKLSIMIVDTGSPPRMRGAAFCREPVWFALRITPAYAGSRARYKYKNGVEEDHPRVCGEQVTAIFHLLP